MTLCFQLHRAVGGNKDERPYMNRLGSRRVPAQMQVLAAGVSQAASWRRPRTTPDAALQPHASLPLADPRPPRFPLCLPAGQALWGAWAGLSCPDGSSGGLVCQRPLTWGWRPLGQHRGTEAPKEAGPEGPRREHDGFTLFSRPCRASWPKPGGELCFIDKHLFLTPFRIKLSPTCPNCLEAIRVSTAGSFMGTAGANSPLGLWAENELLLTTPNLEPRGPPGVVSQTQLLLRSKGWVRAEG